MKNRSRFMYSRKGMQQSVPAIALNRHFVLFQRVSQSRMNDHWNAACDFGTSARRSKIIAPQPQRLECSSWTSSADRLRFRQPGRFRSMALFILFAMLCICVLKFPSGASVVQCGAAALIEARSLKNRLIVARNQKIRITHHRETVSLQL